MWTPLAVAVAALSLVLSGWAGWRTLRNRPVILRQLLFAGVIEALLLVEVVVAVVRSVSKRQSSSQARSQAETVRGSSAPLCPQLGRGMATRFGIVSEFRREVNEHFVARGGLAPAR